jgi:hypothetical protein
MKARKTSEEFEGVLRVKRLVGSSIVRVAAKHNLREIQYEIGVIPGGRIDPTRASKNAILRGPATSAEVADLARSLMAGAGVGQLRKDAVRAVEIVFSLPPSTSFDPAPFFADALSWAERHFAVPLLSVAVHNDEGAPHCHVLMLPLLGGRMVGSDLVGGPGKLRAMHTEFHEQVGKHHGLTRQAPQRRVSAAIRKAAAHSAIDALKARHGLLIGSGVEAELLKLITADPAGLLSTLGIAMPGAKPKRGAAKTFVAQMTKPVKPDRTGANPIGFEDRTLSCVGFQKSELPNVDEKLLALAAC